MTSLAQQLQKLALPEARATAAAHKRLKKSLLFEPAEAAGVDRETFYAIGVNGLQELQGIDPRFQQFEGLLFDEASKSLERSVQTKEVNANLNKKIKRFLLTVSPYFMLKPAQKAMEWLVYRFHIYDYNMDELMMCILPYHETKVFVRAVQLLSIQNKKHKWNWMEPIQKPGVSLSRLSLVNHCIADGGFLHFVCELPVLAIRAHKKTSAALESDSPPSDTPLRVVFSFYATTIVSAVSTPKKMSESFLATLVPFLLRGLKQNYPDYNGATYMIICQLGVSATLKNALIEPLTEAMCQYVKPGMLQEMLGCLAVLCQTQNLKELPGKVLYQLCSMPHFLTSLNQLSKTHNIIPLLSVMLPQLTRTALHAQVSGAEAFPEGCEEVDLTDILSGIFKEVQVESQTVVSIARCLLHGYVSACCSDASAEVKGQLRENISPVVQALERRFPEVMDLILETYLSEVKEDPDKQEVVQGYISMYSGSTKHQLLPQSNTSLVLSLNHANPDVRKMAVNHIAFLIKKGEEVDSFLEESLLQRLNDDSFSVINAVLQIDEYLCEILPVEAVFEAMKKLVQKFRRRTGQDWNTAVSGAISIITSKTFTAKAPHLADEAVAVVMPYFFTSTADNVESERLVATAIAKSNMVLTHPILKGLKPVLTSKRSKDESEVTRQVLDLLCKNMAALEQDRRDKMISALLLTMDAFSRPRSYCLLVEILLVRLVQLVKDDRTKLDIGRKLLGVLEVDVRRTCAKESLLKGHKQSEDAEEMEQEEQDDKLQPVSAPSDDLPPALHAHLVNLLMLKRKYQLVGKVYLFTSQVRTLLWVLDSLVLSLAPLAQSLAPESKWWFPGTATGPSGGQYVTFMLKLLDLLMQGSNECRLGDGLGQGYRLIVQSVIQRHFSNMMNFVKLLSVGWMGHVTSSEPMGFKSSAIFQVRCLSMAAMLFRSMPREIVLRVLERESVVIPTLLIALSSPLESVRAMAIQCLETIQNCIRGNKSGPYQWLVHRLLKKRDELTMDVEYVTEALGRLLMKANEAPVETSPSKKRKGAETPDVKADPTTLAKHCLEWLIECVKEDGVIPHHAQSSLLCLLYRVDSQIVLSSLLGMLGDLLTQASSEGTLSAERACSLRCILGHVTPLTADHMADERSLTLFLGALSREKPVCVGSESPQTIALQQMTADFYSAILSADVQQTLLVKLIDLQLDTESSATANQIAKVIKKLPITAAQFVTELSKINVAQKLKSVKDIRRARLSKQKKEASSEESSQTATSEGRPWQRVTTILEMLQQRKLGKMEAPQTLVPTLFTVLSLCLELPASEQGASEYIKQLILTTVLNICGHLDTREEEMEEGEDKGKLTEEQFSVELVVQCIRTSDNPQTHNHALLLLATAAKLFPEHVLHNIMAIFTFMGASLLRQDDSHSFQIIHKTVQTVIPALVKASKDQSLPSSLADNLEDVVTMVMQTFVDAFPHIPEHRRLPLFTHLVQSVGGAEYLWRVVLLLIGGYVTKGGKVMLPEETETKGPGRNLEFWLVLCQHFNPRTQVMSLVRMLTYLGTLKEAKGGATKTPSHSTRSLRSGGATQGSKGVTQDLIFDVQQHSPRQLRLFQFTVVGFISHFLTGDEFIGQLVDVSKKESAEMQPLYQKLLEQTLCYIGHVANRIHDNSDPNAAKFWRALLSKAYDVLDKVNSLLPARVFIQVVSGLLGNRLPAIRRKAMELLNGKIIQHKEGFRKEEIAMLLNMVDPLVAIARASRESQAESEELDINRQTALYSLKLLCKLLGTDHRKEFTKVIEVALDVVEETDSKNQVIASGLLCLAETVSSLRAHAIPYLSRFMPPLLDTLTSKTQVTSSDLHLLSTVTAVQKVLETLPHFLSPYLGQLLEQVCRLSATRQEEEKAQLSLRLKACRHQLSTTLPPRVLIPAITECYKTVISTNRTSIGPLMSVLGDHLDHLSKEELLSHHHATVSLFLGALDYRSTHTEDTLAEVSDIEGHVIDALLTMVMKLSEATFRPMFLKFFEWASRTNAPHRLLTFYRLSDSIADRLKSLFSLFAGHVVSNVAQLLDANNVIKTDKAFFDESDADSDEKSALLLGYILDCLQKCFQYDKGEFVTKERFDSLMQPLVDQIENTQGGDERYQARITGHLTPCVVQFMVAARDPSTWQPLNYQILLKTRNSSPKVRYAALTILQSVHTQLGEDYLSLLPETIPFLAELMEDESEEVEQRCQDVVTELEKELGEPLQKYF